MAPPSGCPDPVRSLLLPPRVSPYFLTCCTLLLEVIEEAVRGGCWAWVVSPTFSVFIPPGLTCLKGLMAFLHPYIHAHVAQVLLWPQSGSFVEASAFWALASLFSGCRLLALAHWFWTWFSALALPAHVKAAFGSAQPSLTSLAQGKAACKSASVCSI